MVPVIPPSPPLCQLSKHLQERWSPEVTSDVWITPPTLGGLWRPAGSWWAEIPHPSFPSAHVACCACRLLQLKQEGRNLKQQEQKRLWGYLTRDGHGHTATRLEGHQDGLRSCGIFVFRDIQNSTGENTEESHLVVPALNRGLD